MGEEHSVKLQKKRFKYTTNGLKKRNWMIIGIIIDVIATLGISLTVMFSYKIDSSIALYLILFLLLVIIVLGGELIGVFFGAREQYIYDKENKKVLSIDE